MSGDDMLDDVLDGMAPGRQLASGNVLSPGMPRGPGADFGGALHTLAPGAMAGAPPQQPPAPAKPPSCIGRKAVWDKVATVVVWGGIAWCVWTGVGMRVSPFAAPARSMGR